MQKYDHRVDERVKQQMPKPYLHQNYLREETIKRAIDYRCQANLCE